MKKHFLHKARWLVALLLVIFATSAVMAQSPNTDPEQEVCPGPSDYWVVPDNPLNTFTWTITPATGWTINTNGNDYTVIITWDNVLVPTDYTVILQEDNGQCYTEVSVLVTVNPQPEIPAISAIQPTCALQTGTITVTSPLGPNYEYSINGTDWQASPVFSGLTPGNYNVTVRNEFECTNISAEITIDPVPDAPETPIATLTQPTCAVTSGTIEVTSPLGVTLEYSIDGTTWQASPIFSGLTPGPYTVIVRSTVDPTCESSDVFTINAVPDAPETPIATLTQPTCAVTSGSIEVTSPLGATLEYSIDGTTWQASPIFSGLTPGPYTVIVRSTVDPTCESSDVFTINAVPDAPETPVATIIQPTCDEATGTITITSPVGVTFEYSIDGGSNWQTSPVFGPLISGTYTISVRSTIDPTCQSSDDFVIDPQPPSPTTSPIWHD